MSKLVLIKCEVLDENPNACGWYGYFDGMPGQDALLAAYRTKYPETVLVDAYYDPIRCDDEVSRCADLQRWFLCQAV